MKQFFFTSVRYAAASGGRSVRTLHLVVLALALTTVTGVSAQTKVAHINSEKVLDTMPSRKKAIADLSAIEQRGIAELQEMNAAIQTMYNKHMAEKAGKSAAIIAYEEQGIVDAQKRLEQRQSELDQQFKMLNQQIFEPIDNRLRKAIETVAARNKVSYVIEESTTWYYKGGYDMTAEVVTEVLKLEAEANKQP